MKTPIYSIYKITNLLDNKIYIGKSVHAKTRFISHLTQTKKGPNPNDKHNRYQYLHRAINKHGSENFSFEIIETFSTEEELNNAERAYIDFYNCRAPKGYNLTKGGEGASGIKFSEEQKNSISTNILLRKY